MCQTHTYCVLSLIAGVKITMKTSVLHHKVLTILVSYIIASAQKEYQTLYSFQGMECVFVCAQVTAGSFLSDAH